MTGPSRAAIVGPGRVGTTLGVALDRAGWAVTGVAGGSGSSRDRVVRHVPDARPTEAPADVAADARLIVITTPDDAIEEVTTGLAAADVLREGHRVVHVAGSVGLAPLRRAALAGAGIAACHPAQTVPGGEPTPGALAGAAWAVTAAEADRPWAHDLVTDLGGRPHDVRDADRVLYHAALALGANAVGAAVAVARQLLLGARIDAPEAFLAPLVRASVANVLADGAEALTGPVVRGDVGTIERHLETLDADVPELSGPYRELTAAVLEQVAPTLDADTAERLRALLGRG